MSKKAKPVKTPSETSPAEERFRNSVCNFWNRFTWTDFFCYGAIYFVVFFACFCVYRVGSIVTDQRRQINELIDRLNQYEDASPIFDREDYSDKNVTDDLSAWVRKNLPAKCIDERPAVAEVFSNLADMLDEGTLTGESDAFSEGIARLQPVATRSVWLPFLSKLTKRLKAARLDSAGLADAFRTVSKAVCQPKSRDYFSSSAPLLLLEGVTGISPSAEAAESPSDSAAPQPQETPSESGNPSLVPAEEPEPAETPDPDKTASETEDPAQKDCPSGNCPVNQNQYYGGYGMRWY